MSHSPPWWRSGTDITVSDVKYVYIYFQTELSTRNDYFYCVTRRPCQYQPGIDVTVLTSTTLAVGPPLPPTEPGRIVTDGGRDVAETDGGTSSLPDGDPPGVDDISDERLDDAGIDIDSLEELSKPELVALLTKLVSDEDSSASDASSETDTPSTASADTSGDTATATPEPTTGTTASTTEPAADSADPAAGANNISVPDEPADDVAWETTDGYERPPELALTPGTTVLVQCGSQDDRKQAARGDLLGLSESDNRNVLLIQYRAMAADELEAIATGAQRVKVITIGCTQPVPASVTDVVETVEINNPNDVTRLGILATSTLDDWVPLDGQIVVSLDPLDVMFQYKTAEATFRFLHIFLGKLSSREAISHFFVNPSASDPQAINTLKPLFDDVLTIDSVGVDIE